MTKIDHEKNNRKARALASNLPGKGEPSLKKIKASDAIVDHRDLLRGKHIRSFQEEADLRISSPKDLRVAYQRIACSCIKELALHRDIRQITRMFNAMPSDVAGTPKERMVRFLTTYGQVGSSVDDSGQTVFRFDFKKKPQLGDAIRDPWWTSKP